MVDEYVLVLDCGSTNIAVVAVSASGGLCASAGRANGPAQQEGAPEGWLVWDIDRLWTTLCACIQEVCEQVGAANIRAVICTTWGADGAPVDSRGRLTHPPIAWGCPRGEDVRDAVVEKMGAGRLFEITGYQVINFNTLFRLVWLRRNAPEALDGAETWMMMPGLLSWKLSGQKSIDATSASTMMALDLDEVTWSEELLAEAGLDGVFFPPIAYPGEVIGEVSPAAAERTGLRTGTAVVCGGHDTQFAPIGSGASQDEALLSSGTWEILMARTSRFDPNKTAFCEGLLYELDAVRGLYNPQLLMMGSGVLEWVRENYYGHVADREEAYSTMIEEAREVPPGSGGVLMTPSFVPESGPNRKYNTAGTLTGLTLSTSRAHVYRAALEGLCFQLKDALAVMRGSIGFCPEGVRVVGGGSRNELWNQLRADVCQTPVTVTGHKEATVLGAAIFAWIGAGRFSSVEEAWSSLTMATREIQPSSDAYVYRELYEKYRELPPALCDFYSS